MGNEIWENRNLETVPEKAITRINKFYEYIAHKTLIFDKEIIDIGAGNGYLSNLLKAEEYDYYPKTDQKYIDLLDYVTYPKYKIYDICVMSHVLEHITLIDLVLNNLYNITNELFIAVPDSAYNNNKHQPFNKDLGHVSFLTEKRIIIYINHLTKWNISDILSIETMKGYQEIFVHLKK